MLILLLTQLWSDSYKDGKIIISLNSIIARNYTNACIYDADPKIWKIQGYEHIQVLGVWINWVPLYI